MLRQESSRPARGSSSSLAKEPAVAAARGSSSSLAKVPAVASAGTPKQDDAKSRREAAPVEKTSVESSSVAVRQRAGSLEPLQSIPEETQSDGEYGSPQSSFSQGSPVFLYTWPQLQRAASLIFAPESVET